MENIVDRGGILDFLSGFQGTEWVQLKEGIQFKGITTRPQGIRVSGKLRFSGHPMINHFKFLQSKTKKTAKMTIPSSERAVHA